MGNCEISKKHPLKRDTWTNIFLPELLALSGDIHPNPGPSKLQKLKIESRTKTHLVEILTLYIVIISQIQLIQDNQTKSNNLKVYFENTPINLISLKYKINLIKNKKESFNKNKNNYLYLCLLLIISGDVKLNPGPENCDKCKKQIEPSKLIKCENCEKTYHLSCEKLNKMPTNKHQYSWICPNLQCQPNYVEQISETNYIASENKFTKLKRINEKHQNTNSNNRKNKSKNRLSKYKNKPTSTWDELPLISSKDYIGYDICFKCLKRIHQGSRIKCTNCHSKAHIKCLKISANTIKKNETIQRICNICTKDDIEIKEKINIENLKPEELPKNINNIKTGKNELLIVHMNVRSLINKMEDVLILCQNVKPDLLCITETWLNESVPQNALTPQGYKEIRLDRSETFKEIYGRNKGGGIIVFYKEELDVEKKILCRNDYEENLWIHVKTKCSFLLGIIYRTEYCNILKETDEDESKLEKYVQSAYQICDNVIILGDLNADVKANSCCPNGKKVNEIFNTYGLSQIIETPTRIDPKTRKSTLIDHIWINKQKNVILQSGTGQGLSDHFSTFISLNIQKPRLQDKIIRVRSYKNYDPQNFCKELKENINKSNILNNITDKKVNEAMNELLQIIQQTTENHAPMTEIKIRANKNKIPWFTDELIHKINIKNKILHDWHLYGLKEDQKALKKIKNEVNHLKAKLKRKYYTEELEKHEGDSKKSWKVLNEALGKFVKKESIEPTNMTEEKANTFNKFFATVGLEIQKKLKTKDHNTTFKDLQGFNFKPENEENIAKLIDKLQADVAVGYDNISSRIIKDSKDTLTPWLTKIINIGYETSTFPDNMKIANIKPIFKENNKEKIANYRPISILPVISKVFERSCTDQLVKFLEENDKISRTQHAYRKGHSTQTCLVEIVNQLYENKDKKNLTAIIHLDLSKAFDSISHSLLLHKLAELGLAENSINYVKSYLTNRKQRTKFNNCISEEETVKSGIPQGSILGPILFVCFTNDLATEFNQDCKVISYADDTQLIVNAKSSEALKTKIEQAIKTAQEWYNNNSMKNNVGKTEILIINKARNQENVEIEIVDEGKTRQIKSEENIKILGTYIDSQLNWDKHIKFIKKRSMNAILNLNRLRKILPEKTKILLYNTIVTPHFSYADVVWNGCSKGNAKKLQTAQNFAVRIIKNKSKRDSAEQILKDMKFLNLKEKRQVHEGVFIKKALLNKLSQNITNQYLEYLPNENTRQAETGKLNIPKHRTATFKNSPLYRTIKVLNSIPSTINEIQPKPFKNQYQKYLIEQKTH